MASALLAARRKSNGAISVAPQPQIADEEFELVLLPHEGSFYSGQFDMVTSKAGMPSYHDTLPHLTQCRKPLSLTVNPPSDAAPEGTLVLADTGDRNVFIGELDKNVPQYAALVPLSPKEDGTKRMGVRLLDAAVSFHKQVQNPIGAAAAGGFDEEEPVVATLARKNRFATLRAEVLRKQGQHDEAAAEKTSKGASRAGQTGPPRGTTADQRRDQKINFAYEKKYEADEAAEMQNTGRYHRLMPDDDDGMDETYRGAFRAEGDLPAAKSQRYGGISGSGTHAEDEMLGESGQGFGSFRDDAAAHLEEFHIATEDEEGAWYDQDANDQETSAKIEAQHQVLLDATAADKDGDDGLDEEEEEGKQLTEKQRHERLRTAMEQQVEADAAREREYQRTVGGAAAKAARAAAAAKAAAAAARASKKRPREESPPAAGSAMGPPMPRSAGPPAAKSMRLGAAALSAASSSSNKRNPFDGSVDPKIAIAEEITRELKSHGMSCKYRIVVNFLRSRIRACGEEYRKIALAALKRLALQEKNAQGETVYKLKSEYWK